MPDSLFVVGAGPGVASAVAELFAKRGFRCARATSRPILTSSIGLISRSQSTLDNAIQSLPRDAKTASATADATDIDGLQHALDKLHSSLGAPSIVLYNVGALWLAKERGKALLEMDPRDLDVYFNAGVRGALVTAQWAVPKMSRGSLLFTAGDIGNDPTPHPTTEGLAMDKAALLNLTKSLTRDVKHLHIGVVAISGVVGEAIKKEDVAERFAKLHDEASGSWTRDIVI